MTAELTPFFYDDGAEVRTTLLDGEPWFVAPDVARILGYSEASAMTRTLDSDEKGLQTVQTPGGRQEVTIISEGGLYSAVLRSRLSGAKVFRRWITHDVIPQIRRTGSYAAPVVSAAPALEGPELMAAALIEARRTLDAAEARAAAAETRARELAPKAAYVDDYVTDDDLRLLRNVAKSLGLAEGELRHALLEHGWIYQEKASRWSQRRQEKVTDYRYSAAADKRAYFRPVPAHDAPRFKGEVMHTLKVTPAGAQAIARAAQRWGLADPALIAPLDVDPEMSALPGGVV